MEMFLNRYNIAMQKYNNNDNSNDDNDNNNWRYLAYISIYIYIVYFFPPLLSERT